LTYCPFALVLPVLHQNYHRQIAFGFSFGFQGTYYESFYFIL